MAAAYAENGEFANAIRTAHAAMQLARMHGEDYLTTDLDQQIRLYQLRMPYHETKKYCRGSVKRYIVGKLRRLND